ncbi:amidase [Gemella sp. GH3]|uniref:amidase family protein n=1 Tax=unclassified Gemella TaxID=2624949 RepID=UPI0015D05A34|nr:MULTISPECIES: amidase family protein [unclassified Gemella]MBF0713739.1 amidase [Gemella sp. GH3.1]NYS50691.1 amidase [Gemella sp. GH3]
MKNKFKIIVTLMVMFNISTVTLANNIDEKNVTNINNEKNIINFENNGATSSVKKLTKEEYKTKTALELAELVREKQVTSRELVELAYEIIEENKDYHAVIITRKELALEEADALEDTGQKFLGVPLLLKGIGHTVSGGENTNGLIINKGKPLSKTDGTYAKKFKQLGFIILGQTNYPELALRNITDSELYGVAKNAHNKDYNAGGSSGGSAVSIAVGMTPIASASDAGGSIRIPAAWNGLIGLKTSRGLTDNNKKDSKSIVSHFPITKDVSDTIALLESLKKPGYNLEEIKDIKKLKIGYTLKSPMGTEVSLDAKKAVLNTVEFLKEKGFDVEEVDNPIEGRLIMQDYTVLSIFNGGLVGNLEKALASKNLTKHNVDPLVWALYVTNRDLSKSKLREMANVVWSNVEQYKLTMEKFHKKYSIFLTPTTAQTAPLITDDYIDSADRINMLNIENLSEEERLSLLLKQWEPMLKRTPFTQVANLTGEPAITLPVYVTNDNLYLGVMLNAAWGMDKVLLDFAKLFEDNKLFKMNNSLKNNIESNKADINESSKNKEDVFSFENSSYENLKINTLKNDVNRKGNRKILPKTSVA